ncbi:MAG TPA: lactate racemase domain-containing protein, partial [Acidobacteriota bacterium]|nr:lactate racemase domain-containing protein [Acidobacteriota bacterium]
IPSRAIDIESAIGLAVDQTRPLFRNLQNKKIAIAVGSRGISHLAAIIQEIVGQLRRAEAEPFVVGAMGSHGGGTEQGQREILRHLGVDEISLGVAVRTSLETVQPGKTRSGLAFFMDRCAWESDGVFLINRIKPHTDFRGALGSGLLKMMTVGLGNLEGAQQFHRLSTFRDSVEVLQEFGDAVAATGKILGGLAVIENARHQTEEVHVLPAEEMRARELTLFERARSLMPSLPVSRADLLILDEIGKNISGVGMDPNVTGRWYRLGSCWQETPDVTRIAVLDVTDASGGNAVGIGLADFCSRRAIEKMDPRATALNAVTAGHLVPAKIPITSENDRETLEFALASLAAAGQPEELHIVRAKNTLELEHLQVSEPALRTLTDSSKFEVIRPPESLQFDAAGRLAPLPSG